MGYSITFNFHPKKDKSYDMESTKSFSKHVGKEDEDTPLEQVAYLMKAQFARRDILVVDCEVHEYTKKKIKVKDIKGGVQLKDQKFIFDELRSEMHNSPADAEVRVPVGVQPHELMARPATSVIQPQSPVPSGGILRMEIFDPEPRQLAKLPKSYKFTVGNKYPIFKEISVSKMAAIAGGVSKYVTKDDRGMEVEVDSDYFVRAAVGLIGGFDLDNKPAPKSNLTFQDYSAGLTEDMMAVPDIRRR